MSEQTTRRGFLKFLGKGGAIGAAMSVPAAGLVVGMDKGAEGTKEKVAFNFMCMCGWSLIADVPEKVDTVVTIPCGGCPRHWRLTWKGDHFDTIPTGSGFYGDWRHKDSKA